MNMQNTFDDGELVEAQVKWYQPSKGYGFVEISGTGEDAFLHVSALERAGLDAPDPGAVMSCRCSRGQRGMQVNEVLELLKEGDPNAEQPRGNGGSSRGFGGDRSERPRGGGFRDRDAAPEETLNGSVKWFREDKGFGFIVPENGGEDVFFHRSCLDKAGLSSVEEGSRVEVGVRSAPKGREAVSLRLLDQ